MRDAMRALLGTSRVLGDGQMELDEANAWAADQLRAGKCPAYVQAKDKAEDMLAAHNAKGGCDLRCSLFSSRSRAIEI